MTAIPRELLKQMIDLTDLYKTEKGRLMYTRVQKKALSTIDGKTGRAHPLYDFLNANAPAFLYRDAEGNPTNRIPAGAYDRILFTSDLHADMRRFARALVRGGLIKTPASWPLDRFGVPDSLFQDLELDLITDSEWIPERTLFVIVGDIVDGKRPYADPRLEYGPEGGAHQNVVTDPHGGLEFMLLAFLYNLRVSARTKGSDIVMTLGNHDLDTLFFYQLAQRYVHSSAVRFFTWSFHERALWLTPFFMASPYITLEIETEKGLIVAVHGGLHRSGGSPVLPDSIAAAQKILFEKMGGPLHLLSAKASLTGRLTGELKTLDTLMNRDLGPTESPLWSRYYIRDSPAAVCAKIDELGVALVVVGHCPTNMASLPNPHLVVGAPGYEGCERDGCVILGCEASGAPKLAFVDTMHSECFGPTESGLRNEYLVVDLAPAYRVYRWTIGKRGDAVFTQLPAIASGGGAGNSVASGGAGSSGASGGGAGNSVAPGGGAGGSTGFLPGWNVEPGAVAAMNADPDQLVLNDYIEWMKNDRGTNFIAHQLLLGISDTNPGWSAVYSDTTNRLTVTPENFVKR